jgi:hypothetical protein
MAIESPREEPGTPVAHEGSSTAAGPSLRPAIVRADPQNTQKGPAYGF